MKKILLLVLGLIFSISTTKAQDSEPNCVGYTAQVGESTSELLGKNTKDMLQGKVGQIITRNSLGKVAINNVFSIVADVVLTEEKTAEVGMKNVFYCQGELTLYAVSNLDKSNYGSVIVNLSGSGKSKDDAVKNMVSSIKAYDAVFSKFLKQANSQIVNYYNDNLRVFINKAETLIAQEKYAEAEKVLESIPECVPAYNQSAEAIKSLSEIVKKQKSADDTAEKSKE